MNRRRLPRIMVAPNGGRRGKADHPAIPITIPETVATLVACWRAGAEGAHVHVRDREGRHVLDAGLYRELLGELSSAVPEMICQITTESVGRYRAADQIALLHELRPEFASVALREILAEGDERAAEALFHWARDEGVSLQHILYEPGEVDWLADLVGRGVIPREGLELMFVLGRYSAGQESTPDDLLPFLERLRASGLEAGWACCAFGRHETDCLVEAVARGGKARIGFENNIFNRDGRPARDNAERVAELVAALEEAGLVAPPAAKAAAPAGSCG